MKGKKVIVTGGAGFIGSHIVDACIERGADVNVIDDLYGGKRENVNKRAKFHELDICDIESIKPIFDSVSYVFHEAALPRVQFSIENPALTHDVNVDGMRNVLICAHEAGAKRVVYAASSSAYGDQEKLPLTEDMEAQPKSPYGLQKYMGELMCKLWSDVYGLQTVSLRYFNVYGTRHDPDGPYALVIGKFLKQLNEGKAMTITGDGEQTRDFTHISDVVRANLLAAESNNVGKGEVMNIGSGNETSVNELSSLIGGPTEYIEARLEPKRTRADITLAMELLGWEPLFSFEEGIEELKKEYGLK